MILPKKMFVHVYIHAGTFSKPCYPLVCSSAIHILLPPTIAYSMGEWVAPLHPLVSYNVTDGILPDHMYTAA